MTSQDTPTLSPTSPPGIREIGSDFELVDDHHLRRSVAGPGLASPGLASSGQASPGLATQMPWGSSEEIIYLQSGRQALAFAETELRKQGHTQLHVPSYLCDSMITPFQRTGWTLNQLPVDSDLAVSPARLLSQVTAGVLLHTPYFGRQDSPAMLAALDTLRRRGVVIIVDETHRLFSGPSQVADIRVASLRKLLPVYDGGYVAGLPRRSGTSLATLPADSEIADLREMACIAKSGALASGGPKDTQRALFAKAERATHNRPNPAQLSDKSLALMRRLDLDLIRETRQANSAVLALALAHHDRFRIINPPAVNLLPSHLVLETDDVSGLRQYLTQQQIYCPVHWPASELLPRTGDWPRRYISLPIDHRYGEPDMLRVAAQVTTFFARS